MSLIDEINRDIKQERLEAVFTKHGRKLVIASIAILIITAAYVVNKNVTENNSLEVGGKYLEAYNTANAEIYAEVVNTDHKGFTPMAVLSKAGLLKSSEKYEDAINLLENEMPKGADKGFIQAAELQKVVLMIKSEVERGDKADEILNKLTELSKKDAVFEDSAKELKANYLLDIGKKDEAIEIFQIISSDQTTPVTLQQRAIKTLAIIE